MRSKAVGKILLDLVMTLALLFLMGFQFWGEPAHEWVGIGIFALFMLHQIGNRCWYKNLRKGTDTYPRICGAIVNILLLLVILTLAYSGVMISRHVFGFLGVSGDVLLARRLHIMQTHRRRILSAPMCFF